MSFKKDNNSRNKVSFSSTFNAYIAKAKKISSIILDINQQFAAKYKVQPLLLMVPFAAGIIVATSFNGTASNNSSNIISTAGVSSPISSTTSYEPSPEDNILLAQVDEAQKMEEEIEKMVAEAEAEQQNQFAIPDEMREQLSPEEIAIFDAFQKMAQIQEEKGPDSKEVEEISKDLDVLINKMQSKQEAEAEKKALTEAANAVGDPNILKAPEPTEVKDTKTKTEKAAPANKSEDNKQGKITNPVTRKPVTEIPEKLRPDNKTTETTTTETKVTPKTTHVTTPSKPVITPASSKAAAAIASQNTNKEVENKTDASEQKEPESSESDILEEGQIRIMTNDGIIDLTELLIAIGKELELNYYFEDGSVPSGNIMLQQYGVIDRSELLPLLESVLAKAGYMMVKEDPYTKIVKRNEVHKNTAAFWPDLDETYEGPDDSVVTTIVTLNYTTQEQVGPVLNRFIPYTDIISPIENTNKIVISDYAHNLQRILEIIKMIDVPGPQKKLSIIEPEYLKPERAKEILEEMYSKMYGESGISEPGSPEPEADPKQTPPQTAAQRIQASRDKMAKNAAAKSATDKGKNSPDIIVDKRTGRIFIISTEKEFENIQKILTYFDVPKSGPQVNWEIYSPVYVDSKNVVTQIETLMKAMTDEETGLNPDAESSDDGGDAAAQTAARQRAIQQRRATNNQEQSSSSELQGMFIHVDERTNRIIVLGWPDQIELFDKLFKLFDIPLPGGKIEIEIIPLNNTDAGDTLSKVKDLLTAFNKKSSGKAVSDGSTTSSSQQSQGRTPRQGNVPQSQGNTSSSSGEDEDAGPFMLADERLNRIIIIGVKDEINQAKEFTEMIDQEWPGSEVRLEIFTFDVVEVEAITEQVTQLIEALNSGNEENGTSSGVDKSRTQNNFSGVARPAINSNGSDSSSGSSFQQAGSEGPFLMADSRLNRLFVVGLDEQIKQVEDMIKLLDKSIGLDLSIIPAFKYILSSDAANQISSLMSVIHEQDSNSSGNTGNSSSSTNRRNNRNNNSSLNNNTNRTSNSNSDSSQTTRESISSVISVSQRGPFLFPDDRTNRLLVVSTKEQYNEIINLIPILDIPPSQYDEMTIEAYDLKHVMVEEVQEILDSLGLTQTSTNADESYRKRNSNNNTTNNNRNQNYNNQNYNQSTLRLADENMLGNIEEPEIYVAAHKSLNRLFVYAAKYQHDEIKKMIDQIDVEPDKNKGDYQVFSIKHQDPEKVATALKELVVEATNSEDETQEELHGKSVISTIEETPFIVVKAPKWKRDQIAELIKELDKAMPQVLIEAQFIQISLDDSFKLGVSMQNSFDTGGGNSVSGISPLNLSDISTNSNGVAIGTGGTVAFFKEDVIKATLEALISQGNTEVTSQPRLLVSDNFEATFTSTKQKPTTKTTLPAGSDTPITEFNEYVEAGTTLTITPQIGISEAELAEGKDDAPPFISLEISISVDSFEGESTSDGIPPGKSNNELSTKILLPDGATIIMGGLTQTNWSDTVNKIPLLGDLPLIGSLFRNVAKSKTKSVLYLFIRATIAFDPNKDPDFESLKNLSNINQEQMKKLKESFNEMPVIPGFQKAREIKYENEETITN